MAWDFVLLSAVQEWITALRTLTSTGAEATQPFLISKLAKSLWRVTAQTAHTSFMGSAKQVMMDCSNGWNTRLHQCDSLTTSRTTKFFVLAEKHVDVECCWIAQHSWSFQFLYPRLDVASRAELLHKPSKNRCKQWHISSRFEQTSS